MSPNLINLCVIIGHRKRKLCIVRLVVATYIQIVKNIDDFFLLAFASGPFSGRAKIQFEREKSFLRVVLYKQSNDVSFRNYVFSQTH